MCENVKLSCACDEGYDKGVLKKTLENNIFTIFGNLNKNNSIVIRYHGLLTANCVDNSTFEMSYYFDSSEEEAKNLPLCKCKKSIGDSYCATIDLKKFSKIHFCFKDKEGNVEMNQGTMFCLDIANDPITDIMQRYGFEKNENLPTCKSETFSTLNYFKNIIQNIKTFLTSLFMQKSNIN